MNDINEYEAIFCKKHIARSSPEIKSLEPIFFPSRQITRRLRVTFENVVLVLN